MTLRVLLVSDRVGIEENMRQDPGADAYWLERRPPDLVVPAEAAREFAIVLIDFDTTPDPVGLLRALRAANKNLEVISVAGPDFEKPAVDSLKAGAYDYVTFPQADPTGLMQVVGSCAKKVAPPEQEFPAPFGEYTLLMRLGLGGMAEVFLAEHGDPPKRLVVKRMLQTLAADEFVKMFMDESRISSALVHPNIVRVSDFGRADDSLYIAMEYVPGRNLEQLRLALAGPFPPAIACYIVAEICAGLNYAHSKTDPATGQAMNIVHRDINPPNVMIADDGRVMITDFGIAKAAHRYYETSAGTLKGKFEYMSPEQANGKPVDRRADVFCTGLVLYELLTGTRPFMAPTPIETLFLIQECNPQPPSRWNARLPKQLDDICMKALAKDPAQRYQEAAELERDLREFARTTMNPGPRDLATFTKSVARGENEPKPIPDVPTAPLAKTSDGKVTALLQRMKSKEAGSGDQPAVRDDTITDAKRRPASGLAAAFVDAADPAPAPAPTPPPAGLRPASKTPPPATTQDFSDSTISKLSPLVRAAIEEETPAKPMTAPPKAASAAPPPAKAPVDPPHLRKAPVAGVAPASSLPPPPTVAGPARPIPKATPPLAVEIDAGANAASVPEKTITEPFQPKLLNEPAPGTTSGDVTMPGVLADLERIAAGEESRADLPPSVPAASLSQSGGTLIVPADAARTPARTGTGTGELFPDTAKSSDKRRLQIQLGIAVGGGLLLAMLAVFVGPSIVSSVTPAPTPYGVPSPTPMAMATATVAATPVRTEALPTATATPARTALVATTPFATPVATATPVRTAMAFATPVRTAAPTPAKTAAPAGKGQLSIWVEGWANVEIDGRPAGQAPFVGLPIAAGKHRLVLVNGPRRKELEITVSPGQHVKLTPQF